MFDEDINQVPANAFVIRGGNLTGHVGKISVGNSSHGEKGYGLSNEEGDRVIWLYS